MHPLQSRRIVTPGKYLAVVGSMVGNGPPGKKKHSKSKVENASGKAPPRHRRLSVRLGPVPNSRLYRPAPPRPRLAPRAPFAPPAAPRLPRPLLAALPLGPLRSASSIIQALTEEICEIRRGRADVRADRDAKPPSKERRSAEHAAEATSLVVRIPSFNYSESTTKSSAVYPAARHDFNPAGIPHRYPAQVAARPAPCKVAAGDAREGEAAPLQKNGKQVKTSPTARKVAQLRKEPAKHGAQRKASPSTSKKRRHAKRAPKKRKPGRKSHVLKSNLTLLKSASDLIARRSLVPRRIVSSGGKRRAPSRPDTTQAAASVRRMAKDAGSRTKVRHHQHSVSPEDLSDYGEGNDAPSAPNEYLAEFLSSIMQRKYVDALKYCKLILQYEPNNVTAKDFYPLLQQKLECQKDDDFSEEDVAQPEKEESDNGSRSSDDATDKEENELSFCEDGISEGDCSDVEGLLDDEGTDEVEEVVSTGSDSRVEITSSTHTSGETDNSANNFSGLEDEEDNRSYDCDDDNGNALPVASHYKAYGRRIFATHSTLQPDPNDGNQNGISDSASNMTYLKEAANAATTSASNSCLRQLRAQFVHSVK